MVNEQSSDSPVNELLESVRPVLQQERVERVPTACPVPDRGEAEPAELSQPLAERNG